jgi:adenylate cyclase
MAEKDFKRKLTAILSADVEGYSRLMGEDEDATIRTLTTYRELMSTLIQKHRGRVVDSPGDNLLAEFGSVVDGVRCAVEIQEELRVRNAELPENRRMQFRIGINLGDVVEEEERIYGDGINIAARVEGLAEGGGICISGTVYDSIKNKLSLRYESLGEHTVKNIMEPVRVYRMRVGPEAVSPTGKEEKAGPKRWRWAALAAIVALILVVGAVAIWNFYLRRPSVEPASEERMAFPLPEKPSIAVLPFVNMSGDPNQDYISDRITEQIITYLSMSPGMFVIARNSVFTYKGKPAKIQQVAEELGVKYVLEGSVQTEENRLRLTVQLIDALTGRHLWADSYDRDIKDIFALQDEITAKVLKELHVKLVFGEAWRKIAVPENLDFWKMMSKGAYYFYQFTPESNEQARQLWEEAIKLEPEAADAYLSLGYTYLFRMFFGVSKAPGKDFERAFELAQKTIELTDDSIGGPHSLLGLLYSINRQYDKAVEEVEKGVALSPNDAMACRQMAAIYNYVGRTEEAITAAKQAIRLNPCPQTNMLQVLGEALLMAGQYEEAIEAFKKGLHVDPKHNRSMLGLAIAYSLSGREKEAKAIVEEFRMTYPRFSVKIWEMRSPYKNQADTALLVDAMRKAGFPE